MTFSAPQTRNSYSVHDAEKNGVFSEIFQRRLRYIISVTTTENLPNFVTTAHTCSEELLYHSETLGPPLVPEEWADATLHDVTALTGAVLISLPKDLWPNNQLRPLEPDLATGMCEIFDADFEHQNRPDNLETLNSMHREFSIRAMDLEASLCEIFAKFSYLWYRTPENSLQGTIGRYVQNYLFEMCSRHCQEEPIMKCFVPHCEYRTNDRREWEDHLSNNHCEIANFFHEEGILFGSLRAKQWHNIGRYTSLVHGMRMLDAQAWSSAIALSHHKASHRFAMHEGLRQTLTRKTVSRVIVEEPQDEPVIIDDPALPLIKTTPPSCNTQYQNQHVSEPSRTTTIQETQEEIVQSRQMENIMISQTEITNEVHSLREKVEQLTMHKESEQSQTILQLSGLVAAQQAHTTEVTTLRNELQHIRQKLEQTTPWTEQCRKQQTVSAT